MLAPHVVATVAMEMLYDPMIYVVYLSVYLHVSMSAFYNFAFNEGKHKIFMCRCTRQLAYMHWQCIYMIRVNKEFIVM